MKRERETATYTKQRIKDDNEEFEGRHVRTVYVPLKVIKMILIAKTFSCKCILISNNLEFEIIIDINIIYKLASIFFACGSIWV
jgi:hypothetical protein